MDASTGANRHVLPAGLAGMVPGPGLAAALAGIDRSRVAAEDLRDLVRARARQVAFEQAELLADLLEAGPPWQTRGRWSGPRCGMRSTPRRS